MVAFSVDGQDHITEQRQDVSTGDGTEETVPASGSLVRLPSP